MKILVALKVTFFLMITSVEANIVPTISKIGEMQFAVPSNLIHASFSEPLQQSGDSHSEHSVLKEEESHETSDHHNSMDPLFFIILALIIGAGTRHFLQKSPLPFTVMLLIIGMISGVLVRFGLLEIWNLGIVEVDVSLISRSIKWAANIDPHLLLYTFLPVLIFEAAFAMDVHTFKKSLVNATLLAVPGIIVALLLTGAIMMFLADYDLGLSNWTWPIALMFGAVVSATDPVAVVALLKDLGASKKLGTLIEGESLLNDGTAIVLFMVFFLAITGEASNASPIIQFAKVVFGGIIVGGVIGYFSITWIKKVFNDALVEISVIVGAAYLTFFVAEYFFHVSGVLALVTLGLIMAGVGRTRISPEVEHFMHEFWELAGFIANTLLFLIVGVVIAERTIFSIKDFVVLIIVYIGIHIVRAIVIAMLYPFMKRIGYGLPLKDAYVVWYGALRGAIALALALIVAGVDEEFIPLQIRNQFLFYTAGIVTLTLLINATTVKYVVNYLGLTKLTPEKQMMIKNALEFLTLSSEKTIEKIRKNRYTSKANFEKVMEYLPDQHHELPIIDSELDTSIFETRRRILEKEKSAYWSLFKEGMLGPSAVHRLTDGINQIIDSGGMKSLADRADLEEEWKTPELLGRVQGWPLLKRFTQQFFFEKLSVSYDSAMGFVMAQEETLKLVDSMMRSSKDGEEKKQLEIIESEINENRIHGLTFLRNIRNSYPEIFTAISTRQAIRTMLNSERYTVERLVGRGRINSGEASKMFKNIEVRMKRLLDSPPAFDLPKSVELLREVSWLKGIEESKFKKISELFEDRFFSVGQTMVKKDVKEEGLFVLIRGKVIVTVDDKVIEILGPGNVVGEISLLTDNFRSATVTAQSPVTVLWISNSNMKKVLTLSGEFESNLWEIAGMRLAENLLRENESYKLMQQEELRRIIKSGMVKEINEGERLSLNKNQALLLSGKISVSGERKKVLDAPCILPDGEIEAIIDSRLYLLSS